MSEKLKKDLSDLEKQLQTSKELNLSASINKLPDEMVDLTDEINTLKKIISEENSSLELTQLHIRLALDLLKFERLQMVEELNERGLKLTPSGNIKKRLKVFTIEEATTIGLLDGMEVEKVLLKEKLIENGIVMTEFGRFITTSGQICTIEELKHLSLLNDVDIDVLLQPSTRANSTVLETEELSTDDVKYLKLVIGKPLTLALTEIMTKQPRDPIHYLGHWLFKYRYNQEVDESRKREIVELEAERERIRKEKLRLEKEYATKSCLLDVIFKAHDKASRQKFFECLKNMEEEGEESRESQESEESDNYLDEEARDVLGDLPVKNKINK